MKKYSSVLTIAGSDSSGGAGIQADIKAISACGGYASSVITAITAQNTCGVLGVYPLAIDAVRAQLCAVLDDLQIDAIKIGMLGSAEIVDMVADVISEYHLTVPIVLDPVLVATSGDRLSSNDAAIAIVKRLFPLVALVTPNLEETATLVGLASGIPYDSTFIQTPDYQYAWNTFQRAGAGALLIKGGHGQGDMLQDVLFTHANHLTHLTDFTDFTGSSDNSHIHTYTNQRINTQNTHGTGCSLSSAIATFLARGYPLESAVKQAIDYLHAAIVSGADYQLGKGHGPVNHFNL